MALGFSERAAERGLQAMEAVKDVATGQVKWSCKLTGSSLCLLCTGNGPEFSKELIDHFTAPFFTTRLNAPGRGLGLTLAQIYLTRLGWRLTIERNQETTCVGIEIPLASVNHLLKLAS